MTYIKQASKPSRRPLMPIITFALFVAILLLSNSPFFAQSFTENSTNQLGSGYISTNASANAYAPFSSGATVQKVGWFSDWRTAAILAIGISVLIIGLAYMAGIGFNLHELKAWADVELTQVFGSALLIIALVGTVAFFDSISDALAQSSGLVPSGPNFQSVCGAANNPNHIPCSILLAETYIDSLSNVSYSTATGILSKSETAAKKASYRVGLSCNSVYCIWAAGSYGPDAGLTMEVDRQTILFDDLSKIMASLQAQRYFLDVVAYGIGPAMLLLGIIFRSFWFTRKLGGLLLAISISLMIVYPLLYVFSWFTLKVAVYGDQAFASVQPPTCPLECQNQTPFAYNALTNATYTKATIASVNLSPYGIDNITDTQLLGNFNLLRCDNASVCGTCPQQCRQIPFPSDVTGCNEAACYACPSQCKISTIRSDCTLPSSDNYCSPSSCSPSCKVQLPMVNDCSACLGLPFYCRVNYTDGGSIQHECTSGANAALYNSCKAAGCLTQLPSKGTLDCNSACGICPQPCRVNISAAQDIDGYYAQTCLSNPSVLAACNSCPASCKAQPVSDGTMGCSIPPDTALSEYQGCAKCPGNCRLGNNSVDTNTDTGNPYPTAPPASPTNLSQPEPVESYCFSTTQYALGCNVSVCGNSCRVAWNPIASAVLDIQNTTIFRYLATDAAFSTNDGSPILTTGGVTIGHYTNPQAAVTSTPLCSGNDTEWKSSIATNLTFDGLPAGAIITQVNITSVTGWDGYTIYLNSSKLGPADPTVSKRNGGACGTTPDGHYTQDSYNTPIISIFNSTNPQVASIYWVTLDNITTGHDALLNASFRVSYYINSTCSDYTGVYVFDSINNANVSMFSLDSSQSDNIGPGKRYQYVNAATLPLNIRNNCKQCPKICRFTTNGGACSIDNSSLFDCSSADCPLSCLQPPPPIDGTTCKAMATGYCDECPLRCRITQTNGAMPPGCPSQACSGYTCPDTCKAPVPVNACSGCSTCQPDCTNIPAIRTDCADLCNPDTNSGATNFKASDIVRGGVDAQNIGTLAIPAIVLPLFNIVIIISFVRILSPLLGGDIEIPGLSRII